MPKLQTISGIVDPVSAYAHISGSNRHYHSSVETMFEMQGKIVKYLGSSLPLRPGDYVIATGVKGSSGVFCAYAVGLPKRGLFFSYNANRRLRFGAMMAAVNLAFAAMIFPRVDFEVGDVRLTIWLGFLCFACAGLNIIRDGLLLRRARKMAKLKMTFDIHSL